MRTCRAPHQRDPGCGELHRVPRGGGIGKKIAPATIINENGEHIGVVGATTQIVESISSTGGIEIIGDNVDDMPALAAILQPTIDADRAGHQQIILVSHLQQLALEKELAPLLHGVDMIIAAVRTPSLPTFRTLSVPGDTPTRPTRSSPRTPTASRW